MRRSSLGSAHSVWAALLEAVAVAFVLLASLGAPVTAYAREEALRVDDQAGLLTAEEERSLQGRYASLSRYVDAGFVTTTNPGGSTESFCNAYVNREFGSDPAVIFAIDMNNRNIYVYANQAGLSVISQADARAITDNIYQYASRGEYYECADAAFSQILAKCQGGGIARPVKHITGAGQCRRGNGFAD